MNDQERSLASEIDKLLGDDTSPAPERAPSAPSAPRAEPEGLSAGAEASIAKAPTGAAPAPAPEAAPAPAPEAAPAEKVSADIAILERAAASSPSMGAMPDTNEPAELRKAINPSGKSPTYLRAAASQLGADENQQNKALKSYLADGGVNLDPAQTAWCAAFINASLAQGGLKGTGSNMARSFLKWGQEVNQPQKGDIVVLKRGKAPYGHVGFYDGTNADGTIRILGGNQSNKVSYSNYSPKKVLGFRRSPDQMADPSVIGASRSQFLPEKGAAGEAEREYSQEEQEAALEGLLSDINPAAAKSDAKPENALEELLDSVGPATTEPGAEPDAGEPGVTSTLARGVGERASQLVGGLAEFAGDVGRLAEEAVPMGGVTWEGTLPEYRSPEEYAKYMGGKKDWLQQGADVAKAVDLGYDPMTTWEEVKESKGAGEFLTNLLGFGAETFVTSSPDMAAVVLNLPAYVTARTGELSQARAEADGKEQPTPMDVGVGALTAATSAFAEKFGVERLLKGLKGRTEGLSDEALGLLGNIKNVAGGMAVTGGVEAATEATQEALEYVGTQAFTKAGVDKAEMLDNMLAGAAGGGVPGAAFGGVGRVRERLRAGQPIEAGAEAELEVTPEVKAEVAEELAESAESATAEGATSEDVTTFPESRADEEAALRAVVDGRKEAGFVLREEVAQLAGEAGLGMEPVEGGYLIAKPENIDNVREAEEAGERYKVLGYVEDKVDAVRDPNAKAVRPVDNTGASPGAQLVSTKNLDAAIAVAEEQAGEGGKVEVLTPEDEIAQRVAAREQEKAAEAQQPAAPTPEPEAVAPAPVDEVAAQREKATGLDDVVVELGKPSARKRRKRRPPKKAAQLDLVTEARPAFELTSPTEAELAKQAELRAEPAPEPRPSLPESVQRVLDLPAVIEGKAAAPVKQGDATKAFGQMLSFISSREREDKVMAGRKRAAPYKNEDRLYDMLALRDVARKLQTELDPESAEGKAVAKAVAAMRNWSEASDERKGTLVSRKRMDVQRAMLAGVAKQLGLEVKAAPRAAPEPKAESKMTPREAAQRAKANERRSRLQAEHKAAAQARAEAKVAAQQAAEESVQAVGAAAKAKQVGKSVKVKTKKRRAIPPKAAKAIEKSKAKAQPAPKSAPEVEEFGLPEEFATASELGDLRRLGARVERSVIPEARQEPVLQGRDEAAIEFANTVEPGSFANSTVGFLRRELDPSDPYVPLLDAVAEKGLGDVRVQVMPDAEVRRVMGDDLARAGFLSNPRTGRREIVLARSIAGNREGVKSLVHELVHASMNESLRTDNRLAMDMENLRQVAERRLGKYDMATGQGNYGLANIDEFMAEALTNPDFQRKLAGIKVRRGGNLWRRFIQAVRNFLGVEVEADSVLAQVLSAAPDLMLSGKQSRARMASRAGYIADQTGLNPAEHIMYSRRSAARSLPLAQQRQLSKTISWIRKTSPAKVFDSLRHKRGWLGSMTTDQILREYGKDFSSRSAVRYNRWNQKRVATARKEQMKAEAINRDWVAFEKTHGEAKARALNDLMLSTTLSQKEPTAAEFAALGKEGVKVYKDVRRYFHVQRQAKKAALMKKLTDFKVPNAYLRARLRKELVGAKTKKDVQAAFKKVTAAAPDLEEALAPIQKAAEKVVELSELSGPYFPLTRHGEYVVAGRKGEEEYVAFHETMQDAQEDLARIEAAGYESEGVSLKEDLTHGGMENAPSLMAALSSKVGDAGVRAQIEQAMVMMLSESSMRKSELQRKGTPGVKAAEMRRGFAKRAFGGAWELGDLETAFERAEALKQMKKDARGDVGMGAVAQELETREARAVSERKISGFDRNIGKFGFLMYLASPSYAVVNATQPWLVTVPYLASKHGTAKTLAAMGRATAPLIKHAGRNMARGFRDGRPPDEVWSDMKKEFNAPTQDMIDTLQDRGIIDPTFAQELFQTTRGAEKLGLSDHAVNYARVMPQIVETMNRISTAAAAYELADGSHTTRTQAAADAVYQTQFDYCVDEQTECLTLDGWKRWDELTLEDVLIAVDNEGRAVESPLTDINVFRGKRRVSHYHNGPSRRFSMVVTGQHDCLVQNYNSRDKKWQSIRKVPAEELKDGHHLLRTPLVPIDRPGGDPDFAALLGWVASEGDYAAFRNCKKKRRVGLGQSVKHNPDYVEEIEALLQRLGGHYRRFMIHGEELAYFTLKKPLSSRVQEAMPDKKLTPQMLAKMTTSEMEALLDAFMKGDGHYLPNGSCTVGQKCGANLEVLQGMATLLGRTATKQKDSIQGDEMQSVHFSATEGHRQGRRTMVKQLQKEEMEVDMVWCPTTEHSTWVARRNGAVFVTGNSDQNKPRWFKGFPGARALTMFKMYAQGMYALTLPALIKGVKGDKQQLKLFAGVMATHTLTAGALGGIFTEPLRLLVSLIPGIDEEEIEDATESFFNDMLGETLGEMATRGIPRGLGIDLHGRTGLDGMMLMGLNSDANTSEEWYQKTIMSLLGPVAAAGQNAFKAVDYYKEGEYLKMLSAGMPKAVKDVAKATAASQEGLTSRTGEEFMSADEFGAWESGVQAFGFTPAKRARAWEQRIAPMRLKGKATDAAAQLRRQFVNAGPAERMRILREELPAHNKEFGGVGRARLTPKSLWKSVKARMQRESSMRASGLKYAVDRKDLPYIRQETPYAY